MRLRSLAHTFFVLLFMYLAACGGSGLPRPRPLLETRNAPQLSQPGKEEAPLEGPPALGRPVAEITKSGMTIYRGATTE